MTEATEQNNDGIKQLGQKLKDAREQKKLSLEHVAETTRINIETLKKIEQGHLEQGPAPVFMRGFIKTYGTLLGFDKELLQAEFDQIPKLQEHSDLSDAPLIPSAIDSSSSRQKLFFFIILLLIVGVGYMAFTNFDQMHGLFNNAFSTSEINKETLAKSEPVLESKKEEDAHEQSVRTPQANIIPPEASAKPSPESVADSNTEPEKPERPVAASSTEPEKPVPVQETITVPSTTLPVIATIETAATTAATEKLLLSVKASKTTWLDITIDNDNPIEVYLQPGEDFSSEAKEQYVLTIGNTKGVQLFLNGKLQIIDQQKDLLENLVLDLTSLTSSE
ncbi:MAG: helix-turn-helix domain-containing protein [SAR324 cluster bacterium]|nr:helix-turn-helix domain-containing protein [SAR324 cluster bacterium]